MENLIKQQQNFDKITDFISYGIGIVVVMTVVFCGIVVNL